MGADRVGVTGVRGSAPPERLKVCVNELGGHRNAVEFVLTGLDIEAKAAWVREQLTPSLTASSVTWTLGPLPAPDADTEEGASTLLRCTVQDASPDAVGRAFSAAAVELALASYPGFTMTAPPGQRHAVRRLPGRVRRPLGRHPHRAPRGRPRLGGRGPATAG